MGEIPSFKEKFGITPKEAASQDVETSRLVQGGAEYQDSGALKVSEGDLEGAEKEMKIDLLTKGLLKHFAGEELRIIDDALNEYRKYLSQGKGGFSKEYEAKVRNISTEFSYISRRAEEIEKNGPQ